MRDYQRTLSLVSWRYAAAPKRFLACADVFHREEIESKKDHHLCT